MATVTGQALHDASRRLGGGIITEGVHFFAVLGGYYFLDKQCFDIAEAALAAIEPSPAITVVEKPKAEIKLNGIPPECYRPPAQ